MRGWIFVEKAGYASDDALQHWMEKSINVREIPCRQSRLT